MFTPNLVAGDFLFLSQPISYLGLYLVTEVNV